MNIKANPDVTVQGSRLTFESSVTVVWMFVLGADLLALGGNFGAGVCDIKNIE